MKKASILLVLFISFGLLQGISFAEDLPTLNEALKNCLTTDSDKIEVQNTIKKFRLYNNYEFAFDGMKCIILERIAPEKEFRESTISCFETPYFFTDIGTTHLYLRADMMKRLPDDMRAISLDEADLLIIAENEYKLDQQIINTIYYDEKDADIPSYLQTPTELQQYLKNHPLRIKGYTYKPLYSLFSYISLYNVRTKGWSLYNYNYTSCPLKCNNDEAAEICDHLEDLANLMKLLDSSKPENVLTEIYDSLDSIDFIDEKKVMAWRNSINMEKSTYVSSMIDMDYWEMAKELMKLDTSSEAQKWYPKIIAEKDYDSLKAFVSSQNYKGIDTPDYEIINNKLYIAQIDYGWFDKMLIECIDWLMEE